MGEIALHHPGETKGSKMHMKSLNNKGFPGKQSQNSTSYRAFRQKREMKLPRTIFLYHKILYGNSEGISGAKKLFEAAVYDFFAAKNSWKHFLAVLHRRKTPVATFGRCFPAKKSWKRLFGERSLKKKSLKGF